MALLFLNTPNPASFCLFSVSSRNKYSTNLTINDKSIDGVLGTQTWGGRMVGAYEMVDFAAAPHDMLIQSLLNHRDAIFMYL